MDVSRRGFLVRTAALTGAAAVPGTFLLAAPSQAAEYAAPARGSGERAASPSRNGWPMQDSAGAGSGIVPFAVPGTALGVLRLHEDAGAVLVHVVRRFHYEIDALRSGDVVGWRASHRTSGTAATSDVASDLASGTAVRIRPGFHPAGARGGFFAPGLLVIRDILAECGGVVRWGGDDRAADEALFCLDVPPGDARLTALDARLAEWRTQPGKGAGGTVDVLDGARRRAARDLERRQRGSAP